MTIKQLSVFLENKMGQLAEVSDLLSKANIDIRALSIADTEKFGILRLIVNKPEEAVEILRNAEMMVSLTDVVAVAMEDTPGSFGKVTRIFAENNINIEYLYAFVSRHNTQAFTVVRTENAQECVDILTKKGVKLLSSDTVYNL